jgi:hypothetical protein
MRLSFGKFRVFGTDAALLSLNTTTGVAAYARIRQRRSPLAQ